MDDHQLVTAEKRKRDGGQKTEENAPLAQRQKHDEEQAKEKDGETDTPADLYHRQAKRTCDDDADGVKEPAEEDYFDPYLMPGDPEIVAKYYKQVTKSGGFDFDVFPGPCIEISGGCIDRYCLDYPENRENVNHLAQLALKDYNEEHEKSCEFASVVKANVRLAGPGIEFYITFKVKNNLKVVSSASAAEDSDDSDGDNSTLEIFQAVVWQALGRWVPPDEKEEVYGCFPRPS